MRAAERSNIAGVRWAWTSAVVEMFECPRLPLLPSSLRVIGKEWTNGLGIRGRGIPISNSKKRAATRLILRATSCPTAPC